MPSSVKLWQRLLLTHPLALWYFLRFRPHIVHIFVAELLPLAFIFRWLGAEVIYEVQENLYKKIPRDDEHVQPGEYFAKKQATDYHLTAKGYGVLASQLKPLVVKIIKEKGL